MHQKRNNMPKEWPIPRKGTKYIMMSAHSKRKSIPLSLLIRDLLKIAKTRREAKRIISSGEVKINYKVRKKEKFPVQIFDIISFSKTGESYKLDMVSRKFSLTRVSGEKERIKIVKIIGKKILPGGKIQMNLEDGTNFIAKEKFSLGDSALVDVKNNKIVKILELKPKSKIEVMNGKHAGERGILKSVKELERSKRYVIELKEKEVELPFKTIMVTE